MSRLRDAWEGFWAIPGIMVLVGAGAGEGIVVLERSGRLPGGIYGGDPGAAFGLLSAIGGGALGVAGTTFSITIAALTLASTQMGPRLLRQFSRDTGNKVALGVFLATFAFCLGVLRAVSAADGATFVPEGGVMAAAALGVVCVGTLVVFLHRVTRSIDVMRVMASVQADVEAALRDASVPGRGDAPLPEPLVGGRPVFAREGGYLREIALGPLRTRAERTGARVRFLVRPGAYVLEGETVAEVTGPDPGVVRAMEIGQTRTPDQDPEFAVRQLVEIAVRALSPAINDPFTAIAVTDRLGDALCGLRGRALAAPTGTVQVPGTDFDGLVDAMFLMIAQAGASSPAVVIHLLETLALCDRVLADPDRSTVLRALGSHVYELAMRADPVGRDRTDLEARHQACLQGVPHLQAG